MRRTVSYPYPLAFFADQLPIDNITWDIQRNDEMSGSGDGSLWQAELSTPLWVATVALTVMPNDLARQIAAKIRKLHGAQEVFRLYDTASLYPQLDPDGAKLGSSAVKIESIPGHRASLSLIGLPANYGFLPGDKFTVTYGSNPTRVGFFEISEAASAGADGSTGLIGVFPHLPPGVNANADVRLIEPYCEMKIMPGTHNPGSASKLFTEGAGFKAIQKR